MQSPGPCGTIVCHVCPFACGCKPNLALAGASGVSGHPVIKGIVVAGSLDAAANDLKVAVALCGAVGLNIMHRDPASGKTLV